MKRKIFTFAFAGLLLGLAQAAHADPLPKDAVKLSSAEAKAIYSGKTANWSQSAAYFGPDGRFLMYGKDKSWFAEGKWTVSGNKVCTTSQWKSVKDGKTGKGKLNCWTWYKAGERLLSLWSRDKNGTKDGWTDGERNALSNGDRVSTTVKELKAKASK